MSEHADNVIRLDFARARPKVEPKTQEKRDVFAAFLESGVVSVILDPNFEGTQVPSEYRASDTLVLNFCYAYNISDFSFDDVGISATLTFPQGYFFCFVPWGAVYGLRSDALEKMAFWEDKSPVDG